MTKDELKSYLENYEKGFSSNLDGVFSLFINDVRAIANDYKKGEAFIYTCAELVEEQSETLEKSDLKELQEKPSGSLVIQDINGYLYFI
ncbi:hypothetical protein POQMFEI_00070 [Enterococcus phage vB_OCPT_CCS2]|nr:hypothetical protein POQMFEI_00070 [Enterococcus phage vB_OCPT_CCS2]WDS60673.1 hypothetical protein [Enterococcus phage vB_EfKS5]